jgi:transketolase
LICCKTTIGYGSPNKAGHVNSHGMLGAEETGLARESLGWSHPPFVIPADYYAAWDAKASGAAREQVWNEQWLRYQETYPEQARALEASMSGQLPEFFGSLMQDTLNQMNSTAKPMATRKASQWCLNVFAEKIPGLIGGSADLTGSNNTQWSSAKALSPDDPAGRYIHYGVREFGMAAIMNGMALHGGVIPFSGTFLTFSDYARHAIRLSASMRQRVIYVLSHDSIGVGEDGPTHQPIEHIGSLRLIPSLHVWRPCDAVETAAAWKSALEYQGPTALLLTRQDISFHARQDVSLVHRGAYVMYEPNEALQGIIIATGSELSMAMNVAKKLAGIRVVSMPCVEVFLAQSLDYQESVLPTSITRRVAIEAGAPDGWYRFARRVIGLSTFGLSAPYEQVFEALGMTEDHLMRAVMES